MGTTRLQTFAVLLSVALLTQPFAVAGLDASSEVREGVLESLLEATGFEGDASVCEACSDTCASQSFEITFTADASSDDVISPYTETVSKCYSAEDLGLEPTRKLKFLAIAAGFCLGVAVGVIVTVALSPPRQQNNAPGGTIIINNAKAEAKSAVAPPSPSTLPPCDPPEPPMEGDPHFRGFDGSHFDYHGVPGAVFNVISTADVLVNAALVPELLHGLTYVGSIGVSSPGHRIQVTSVCEASSLLVTVDNVLVEAAGGPVQWLRKDEVRIAAGDVELQVRAHDECFLDISDVRLRTDGAAHGVLGQTAARDRGMSAGYEGKDEDYFVSSLWDSDFAYNVYHTDAHRAMGSVKPLSVWMDHAAVTHVFD